MKLQKLGGYAAIAGVLVYAVFLGYFLHILPSGKSSDPAGLMAAMSANPNGFYTANLLYMVSWILALIPMIALYERMHSRAPNLSRMMLMTMSACAVIAITEAFVVNNSIGIILPAGDLSAFRAYNTVRAGLHSASGHACAWAFLLGGCAILVTRAFSRALGWLALATGILWIPAFLLFRIGLQGILTLLLNLMSAAGIIWIGIELLRQKRCLPAVVEKK